MAIIRRLIKSIRKFKAYTNKQKELSQADVFSEILNEADENVRLWAGTFTLKVFPELAEKTLASLSELSTITALSARATLHLWNEGKLNLL